MTSTGLLDGLLAGAGVGTVSEVGAGLEGDLSFLLGDLSFLPGDLSFLLGDLSLLTLMSGEEGCLVLSGVLDLDLELLLLPAGDLGDLPRESALSLAAAAAAAAALIRGSRFLDGEVLDLELLSLLLLLEES